MTTRQCVLGFVAALLVLGACSSSDDDDGDLGAAGTSAHNAGDPPAAEAFNPMGGQSGVGGAAGTGSSSAGMGSSSNPNIGAAGAGGTGGGFASNADGAYEPAPGNQGEQHTAVGTNPFVFVQHDPFSTFAADVDTASYDLMRRDLSTGLLPVADGVRLEDYVNYFKYDYGAPAADAEHPFEISLAAAPHPSRPVTLLRVGIQAQLPTTIAKKPTNLVFLVDVSGSMQSPDKLPLVQHTLTQTLSMLDPNDTVAIVTYAAGTDVVLQPTRVLEAASIAAAIGGLTAGGGTNGAGGIQLAYQQAEAGFIEGGINHVVLCTDGDFNIGVSSDVELVTMIEQERETGVTLTALGYGIGNLNDSMMEKVSNAGNGIYSLITSENQANDYVETRMLSTIEHVAKDVKIQLELNPEHVLAYRLLGYENRAIADDDFRDDVIDAGEIGAGHRVTALYELVMAGDEVPMLAGAPAAVDGEPVDGEREIDADSLVLVKVRYKQPGAAAEDAAVEVQSSLDSALLLSSFDGADPDMKWALAMAMFAEVVKGSLYATTGDLDLIESLVTPQASRDAYRSELATLLATYRSMQ